MNANGVFILLGLVAFLFLVLFVLASEGVLLAGSSLAVLLIIAFVSALLIYLIVTRFNL